MGSSIYALNANTGATIWSHTMADYATSSPAVANGVVYTGSFDHQIYAFDAMTGDKLWSSGFDVMQGGIPGSVAVVDGFVYIGSKDDKVYAFSL
jgi:outer membrane protein assembly factor BamB